MKGRILLVDPFEHATWDLADQLAERGHEVLSAGTRVAALRILRRFDAHIAVVDSDLADADGMTLVQALRSERPRLKILFTSGRGSETLRDAANRHGAVGFFEKPVENAVLIEALERALGDAEATTPPQARASGGG
jgi:DNA-binding NtrC family response regulator